MEIAPVSKEHFLQVPHEHWSYTPWINETRADEAKAAMASEGVLYGGSLSYRFMCRYNSGFLPLPTPPKLPVLLAY
jgi:alpha 1,2-mannosyltransferase